MRRQPNARDLLPLRFLAWRAEVPEALRLKAQDENGRLKKLLAGPRSIDVAALKGLLRHRTTSEPQLRQMTGRKATELTRFVCVPSLASG